MIQKKVKRGKDRLEFRSLILYFENEKLHNFLSIILIKPEFD